MSFYSAIYNPAAQWSAVAVPGAAPVQWLRESQCLVNKRLNHAATQKLAEAMPSASTVMLDLFEGGLDIRNVDAGDVFDNLSDLDDAANIVKSCGHRVGFYGALQPRRNASVKSWQAANDYVNARLAFDTVYVSIYSETPAIDANYWIAAISQIGEACRIAQGREVVAVLSTYTRDSKQPFNDVNDVAYYIRELKLSLLLWSDQPTKHTMDAAGAVATKGGENQ